MTISAPVASASDNLVTLKLPMIATLGCLVDGQVLTTTPGFHTSSFRPIAGLVWLFEFEGLSVVTHSPRAT
jgi:hypothetical protein